MYNGVVVDDVGAGAVGVLQLLAGRDRSSSQLHSRRLFIGQQRYTTGTSTTTTSNHQRLTDDAHYTNNINIQPVTFLQLNSIYFIMAALWNSWGRPLYFHPVVSSFFFFFFPSPILSRCRLDVCHTSTRGVALVRI